MGLTPTDGGYVPHLLRTHPDRRTRKPYYVRLTTEWDVVVEAADEDEAVERAMQEVNERTEAPGALVAFGGLFWEPVEVRERVTKTRWGDDLAEVAAERRARRALERARDAEKGGDG